MKHTTAAISRKEWLLARPHGWNPARKGESSGYSLTTHLMRWWRRDLKHECDGSIELLGASREVHVTTPSATRMLDVVPEWTTPRLEIRRKEENE
jgi:hypothetical protein